MAFCVLQHLHPFPLYFAAAGPSISYAFFSDLLSLVASSVGYNSSRGYDRLLL